MIRRARSDEAALLSALAIRSKSFWGYSPDQMAVFAKELTLSADRIAEIETLVLERDSRVVGFYTLVPRSDAASVELEHLFVDVGHLRCGHGSMLFEHAKRRARELGFKHLLIQSDPHAEGFYRARGAEVLRRIPTSIPERSLPLMDLAL